jgi:CheY-like chemotaxis protein
MKKILFIDDDYAPLVSFFDDLKNAGFEVTHSRRPDDALRILKTEGSLFHLIILDSMMPPGKRYANEKTESGLNTGGFLFEDIRKDYPEIPVLILTNFVGLEWVEKACGFPKVRQARKIDVNSTGVVEIVQGMIKMSEEDE